MEEFSQTTALCQLGLGFKTTFSRQKNVKKVRLTQAIYEAHLMQLRRRIVLIRCEFADLFNDSYSQKTFKTAISSQTATSSNLSAAQTDI